LAVDVSGSGRLPLPGDMVDADWLCELLGFRTAEAGVLGPEAHTKLATFERAVEDARMVGRIKRFVVRDPTTHQPIGYCYRKQDLLGLLTNRG